MGFVDLVVHLAGFVSAVDVEAGRSADLVIRVIVLHVHSVSAHGRLGLALHLPVELLELVILLLLLLLMIYIDVQWL